MMDKPLTFGVFASLFIMTLFLAQGSSDSPHNNASAALPCIMEVVSYSADYFSDWIGIQNANLAHIKLQFVNSSHIPPEVNCTNDVVLPGKLIWTYVSTKTSFRYLKWPFDFTILSIGLLDGYTLQKEVTLYLNVTPPNCAIVLGDMTTSKMISNAILDFTMKYFDHHSDYMYTIWCYYAEIEDFRKSWMYHFGKYFSFPVTGVGYKCCEQRKNLTSENYYIHCNDKVTNFWKECVMVPYVLGIVLFAYFPIFLVRAADMVSRHDPPHRRRSDGYEPIASSVSDAEEDLATAYEGTERTGICWLHLTSSSPVSFSQFICSCCTLSNHFPFLISRLRRVLFVFLSPAVLYTELIVYYIYFQDFITAFLDHGVPIGFLSMLGGVSVSAKNFVPCLGGPFFTLGLYFTLGLMVMLIPTKMSTHLEKGLPAAENADDISTLLQLDIKTIERRSMIECTRFHGYPKVYRVMQANLYMMINPKSWYWFVCKQKQRWSERISETIFCRYSASNRFPCVILKLVCILIYICVCMIELILMWIIYGIPIINFLVLTVKAYSLTLSDLVKNHHSTCRFILGILYTIFVSFYIFAFSLIFIDSFAFIGKILVFLYLSVLVYPSYAFAYIFFAGTIVYYMVKIMSSFRETYFCLLRDLVTISTDIQKESSVSPTAGIAEDTLYITGDGINAAFNTLNLNGRSIEMTESQRLELGQFAVDRQPPTLYVRYRDHCPGVPKELFDQAVRQEKPIHIHMFLALLQITLICVLVGKSMHLVSQYNKSAEISSLMHVMSIVIVGFVPRLIQVVVSKSKRGVVEEERCRRIKDVIEKFWRQHDRSNQ